MPANYNGNTTGLAGRQTVTISEPVGSDVRNAASVTTPLRKIADWIQFLVTKSGILDVASTWTEKQTFTGSATAAPANLAPQADPSAPANGDVWVHTDGSLKWRGNGATGALGAVAANLSMQGSNTGVAGHTPKSIVMGGRVLLSGWTSGPNYYGTATAILAAGHRPSDTRYVSCIMAGKTAGNVATTGNGFLRIEADGSVFLNLPADFDATKPPFTAYLDGVSVAL